MQWFNKIAEYIHLVKNDVLDIPLLKLFSLIDLTSLNDDDTEASVASMFEKASGEYGHVAAVCVYPQFVRMSHAQFSGTSIKIATVANFPKGDESIISVLAEISRALQTGANEIDVVFPYQKFLAGDKQFAHEFIESCKAACGDEVLLKVILETGALQDLALIADATSIAIEAGADFVKTSTGKISVGASLEAATVMLLTLKDLSQTTGRTLGFKVSGGVRSIKDASAYIKLAANIFGSDWVNPKHFRIGASKLVDEILLASR